MSFLNHRRSDRTDDRGFGVATQRWLQNSSQFGVAEINKLARWKRENETETPGT